jgi:hypothetical protein
MPSLLNAENMVRIRILYSMDPNTGMSHNSSERVREDAKRSRGTFSSKLCGYRPVLGIDYYT